jgi:hypothetical protein
MNTINPIAEKVLRLLLDSGPPAAQQFVRDELIPEVDRAQQALELAKSSLTTAETIIALASRQDTPPVRAPEPDPPTALQAVGAQEDERKAQILAVANELADRQQGEPISTIDVLAIMLRRGQKLAGARPGTSVGNVLFRAPGWIRIGEGKYKREDAHA